MFLVPAKRKDQHSKHCRK